MQVDCSGEMNRSVEVCSVMSVVNFDWLLFNCFGIWSDLTEVKLSVGLKLDWGLHYF